MKRKRNLFVHLGQIRGLVQKFSLLLFFVFAFSLMLLDKTENVIATQANTFAVGLMAPVVKVLVKPANFLADAYKHIVNFGKTYEENKQLRAENLELLVIKGRVTALEIENKILAQLSNFITPDEVSFVTAKVLAEESDAFAHSLLAFVGEKSDVKKGHVVMSDKGVVGRIDKIAGKYAKIILATDINSRIPVLVERTRVKGMLSGDNTPLPKMDFLPLDAELTVGDIVVTSGVAGVFPSGLPIGRIVSVEKHNVRIKMFSAIDRLEYVKIINYDLGGLIDVNQKDVIDEN